MNPNIATLLFRFGLHGGQRTGLFIAIVLMLAIVIYFMVTQNKK